MKRFMPLVFLLFCFNVYAADIDRNSNLPDSANKTDFYNLVDTATIKASAVGDDEIAASSIKQTKIFGGYGLTERKSSAPTDTDSLWFDTVDEKLKVYDGAEWDEISSGGYNVSFDNGDLAVGVLSSYDLTISHNLSVSVANVSIIDNNSESLIPDEIKNTDSNTTVVSFDSFQPLTGTWKARVS